jgi:hypothetical protein
MNNNIDIAEIIVQKLPEDIDTFVDTLEFDFNIRLSEKEAENLLENIHSAAAEEISIWARKQNKTKWVL